MTKAKKQQISLLTIFIVIELILGVLVQTTSGNLNTGVSFLVVVLAFLFSLFTITKSIDQIITTVGLFATVCADIFLVVLNPRIQVLAMIFFSITQICYFLRIYLNQPSRNLRLTHLIIRIVTIIVVVAATILVLKDKTDFLSLISLFYYANLIINVVFSFIQDNRSLLFSIGLILFACCDLLIGFSVMSESYIDLKAGTLFYFLANPGFNLAWIFYVPSQMLIAVSNVKFK